MSADTRAALHAAIEAHSRDEWLNAYPIDWAISVATVDPDGEFSHGTIFSRDPAPGYVIRGLLAEAITSLDYTTDDSNG